MPTIKTRQQLSEEAVTLAESFHCVYYNGVAYIPADCETHDTSVEPPPERKMWLPLTLSRLQEKARDQFDTLFANDRELDGFSFMVNQASTFIEKQRDSLLIRTPHGLRELREDGLMYEPTGEFIPNCLPLELNGDPDDKAEVMSVLTDWLDSEEEALSLLRHCATALAPGWSAVKYILLIGDGRNGKSVFLTMMQKVLGVDNVSSVERQDMSEAKPQVTQLLGSLANIVMDGKALYLKDSGVEKTLVAGETVSIRRLFKSEATPVSTNGLFLEGLNREPRSSDKSSALQSRITRFWFPNTYPDDMVFWDRMMSDRMLGAFLSLLIDNYVKKGDKAVMLQPTSQARSLKLEHMHANSLALQFIHYLMVNDPLGEEALLDVDSVQLHAMFSSWRIKENDLAPWSEVNVTAEFKPLLETVRRSRRKGSVVAKVRVVTGFKKDALDFIAEQKEEALMHEEDTDA